MDSTFIETNDMFCGNCGTQFADGAPVCPNCGTPAGAQAQAAEGAAVGGFDVKKNLPIIIGAAAAVVVVLILFIVAAGGGYKKAIKNYMNAFKAGNVQKMELTGMDKKVLNEYYDDYYDMTLAEYAKAEKPIYDAMWKGLKKEGKVKFNYEIKNAENIDKLDKLEDDVYFDDLDDFIDAMDDAYDDYGFDADKISKCMVVEIKWTLEVGGKKEASDKSIAYVYKYKGKWYYAGGPEYSSIYYDLDDDDFEDVIDDMDDAKEDFYDEID